MNYEDLLYEQDEHAVIGFMNSNRELEFSIYKSADGGIIELKDKKYTKDELSNLLETELENFIDRNKSTTTIIGHEIRIVTSGGKFVLLDDLDNEVYEINQSILDGNDCGDIFIESKKEKAYWIITT